MELLYALLNMLNEMSPYVLLGFFIAGLMHAFVPRRTFARHLSSSGWRAVVKAALAGIPLPLCSCGVLPAAVALRRGGASRAAATSFLVATPQTGVDSIAATWSLLGPAFAVVRPVAALVTAVFGGLAVGCTERTGAVQAEAPAAAVSGDEMPEGFGRKCVAALRYGFIDLVGSIGGWLVAGLVIAALITVYVPADCFAALGRWPLLSMLAVLAVAVPMYVCATGSIPIAMSLVLKGLSPGTALVLLMAGPAANFASFALISREMGRWAALVYLASIIAGALLFGLAVDYLLPPAWFALPGVAGHACCAHEYSPLAMACSAALVVLLLVSAVVSRRRHRVDSCAATRVYRIAGMDCQHCRAAVERSIRSVEGVRAVDVDLSSRLATVEGTQRDEAVVEAVRAAGYDVES